MSKLLEVRNLQAWYGKVQALYGVDLTIEEGQVVSLMGRNGMGKSTTINSICGMMKRVEGEMSFEGVSLVKADSHKIAQLGLGLVPEGRRIFSNLTVKENLTAAARFGALKGVWDLKRVYEMFPGMESRAKQNADTLSGGEQQMLAISRALLTNPKLLILDEATEGLSPVVRQIIWKAIHQLKAEGMSILIVDKTLKQLLKIADHCVILERGIHVWDGKPSDLSEDISDKYLGV